MPSPKNHRRGGGYEKSRKGRLSEKSSSFHGRGDRVAEETLPRPRTVPDLLSGMRSGGSSGEDVVALGVDRPKLTKLLLHVTIQRSLGAVRVMMPPESTVEDLIAAALRQYTKEARLSVLPSTDAADFDLHYSQFSLESLDRKEKLMALGSRNFFMCPKKAAAESGGALPATASTPICAKEADSASKKSLPWLKFMDFML